MIDSNRVDAAPNAKRQEDRDDKKQTPRLSSKGLKFQRVFTQKGVDPFSTVEWEKRDAKISGDKGEVIFEQKNVEIPKTWSQLAANVVVSKYFRGSMNTPQRENSVRQLISRVVDSIASWGDRQMYFASAEDRDAFKDELIHLLLHQYASFNSPVWFNVGVEKNPQCSACFINSVEDKMESILELARTEGMLFKFGSGAGSNLSPIRSSREHLHGGGTASGPVSFMKGYDAFAGVIKSGGKTRRAAKMVILNADHPDIVDFIMAKANEEKKAWSLIDSGYDGSFNGEAYGSVFFQNANHSVRVPDEFMKAVENDEKWQTRFVTRDEICETYDAKDIMRMIAEGTHICGDPGMQFDTTINRWHTCPNNGRINASNPCSEYMFLDDTACNLASLNLLKYLKEDGEFDVERFKKSIDVLITAQEIIVDNASYPTEKIDRNSHLYRTLGLGYANLGALLMAGGHPYDSEEGRAYAAAVTAVLSGEAYAQSARIAKETGPFSEFQSNRDPMLRVIDMHRKAAYDIDPDVAPSSLRDQALKSWDQAYELGEKYGFRNAQVTVLAPTGTIAFMMDCDTTGVEPDIALVKFKNLVGGGALKIVNNTVPKALKRLGYSKDDIRSIVAYIDQNNTIEGAPHLKEEHLPIFDCAFKPTKGKRFIHYMGHIRMMGAVQPFISGAISKTVNLPNESTVQEIEKAYIESWKLGLKAVAVYRDGCKRTQPLNTSQAKDAAKSGKDADAAPKPYRRRLPDERRALTHKFSIGGHEGYITVGLYPDGQPGEIFLTMAKEGTVVSGMMDGFATAVSLTLQYGVPLRILVNKFAHTRFEPSGFTGNPEIPIAKSIMDYIFRWLASKFLSDEDKKIVGVLDRGEKKSSNSLHTGLEESSLLPSGAGGRNQTKSTGEAGKPFAFEIQADAPPCHECGTIMIRSGSCYKCMNCGATSGCS
ncbi:MAG: vitamin B12-dependent ribonucleotide reductase [Candidatus Omnitrophica bacterium]|nr:vitamin B12-dependent ribonucleotide reductase [Candidatus Omnitrophota bacterium]